MSINEALEPCPFCGSPDIQHNDGHAINDCSCRVCGAIGPDWSMTKGEESAIARWNARSQAPPPAWVAVETKLPELRQLVWCSATNEMGESHQSALRWTGACWLNQWGAEIIDTITHWSPLPSPPQAEEKKS